MPGIGKRCTSDEYVAFSSAPKNNTAIFFKNHLKKKKKHTTVAVMPYLRVLDYIL